MARHFQWISAAAFLAAPEPAPALLLPVLAFVCLRPSLAWLSFALTGGLLSPDAGPTTASAVLFWGPFLLVCLYDITSTRGRVFAGAPARGPGSSLSVVVPVRDTGAELHACLTAVGTQTRPPDEIIAVAPEDGRDGSGSLAGNARLLTAERGRGNQIRTGMEAATGDWVVVLHADLHLPPDALQRLEALIRSEPRIVGGVMGQRFDRPTPILLLIELVNAWRALFTRTAFGDQTQFFHRATALRAELMPRQPLMEDVESSWRLRQTGPVAYLGACGVTGSERWREGRWRRRFPMVLRLLCRYRNARLRGRGRAAALSRKLYAEYYGED